MGFYFTRLRPTQKHYCPGLPWPSVRQHGRPDEEPFCWQGVKRDPVK